MTDHSVDCKETIVHQSVKVQAQVTVDPHVKCGRPRVHCIDSHMKPGCEYDEIMEPDECDPKCTFTLTQLICVEIPVIIGVDVDVGSGIIRCGKPDFGPCKPFCDNTQQKDQEDESSHSMATSSIKYHWLNYSPHYHGNAIRKDDQLE